MTFWSGATLETRLGAEGLVSSFSAQRIDCAAYRLRLGSQVYISPGSEAEHAEQVTIRTLWDHDDAVTVPPGQFAFLITEETVSIPADAIAFISIRARLKWRGLVNVSGFHVDPGYQGRLIFSVFNAGPAPVHLKKGEEYFLIWYADLDGASRHVKSGAGFQGIPTHLINPIAGQVQSFAGLLRKLKDTESKLEKRIQDVERDHFRLIAAATVAGALLVGMLGFALRDSWTRVRTSTAAEIIDLPQKTGSGSSAETQTLKIESAKK